MQVKKYGVIDRFEGENAIIILENKEILSVSASVTENAVEGDCVTVCQNKNGITVTVDKIKTEQKNESIRSRFDRLKK